MRQTNKKIVDDPVVKRIIDTLNVRHLSQKSLLDYLDLPNATFTAWKYDGGKSYMKYIDKISDYLNVSKNYLLYGESENFQEISLLPSEIESYKKLHELTAAQQKYVMESINLLWDANHHV